MDIEKSRKFYQDRYYKAIKQFGQNSLTAIICKKKLALISEKLKQQETATAPLDESPIADIYNIREKLKANS